MQFTTTIAISAIAATAAAQLSDPNAFAASFAGALITAAPEVAISLLAVPEDQQTAAVASALYGASSGFPSWVSAMPTDIQSYLSANDPRILGVTNIPSGSAALPTGLPSSLPDNSTISSAASNLTVTSSASLSRTSTVGTTTRSSTRSASAAASSSSTGGAAAPTAIIGSGIMGAIAFAGLLAL